MSRCPAFLALSLLTGCVLTGPDRVQELSADGLHLYRQGAYADARGSFQTALALQPNDPDLLYNLARCHDRLKNAAEADQLYRRVLEYAPNHLEARHAILLRQIETGQVAQARQMIDDWLRRSPRLAGPYVEDAWLRARDGDLDSARSRLLQALDYEPRHPRALAELGRIYEKLDRPDRAVVLYERSLEANPDQPPIAEQVKQLRARGVSRPRPD